MSHYYTDNKDLLSNRKEFDYYFDNEVFRFTTDNGVFSKKGVDYGSDINDPYKTVRKRFIHKAPLQYTISPSGSYIGRYASFEMDMTVGDERAFFVRTTFHW